MQTVIEYWVKKPGFGVNHNTMTLWGRLTEEAAKVEVAHRCAASVYDIQQIKVSYK